MTQRTDPRPFVMTERVRWADVDLVAIMRFSAFTRLVELAEQEMLRAAGLPYSVIFDAPDVWMPRRALTIEYFAPARIDEELLLIGFVSRIGETSLTINVDVRRASDDALVAGAAMAVVCVTASDFRKRPLPGAVREALAPFVRSIAEVRGAEPGAAG